MKTLIGVTRVHKKSSISKQGTKSVYYRTVVPCSVLDRLGVWSHYRATTLDSVLNGNGFAYAKYIAFKKKSNDVQLVKLPTTPIKKIQKFMGLKKIGTKNRICLPDTVVEFFNIVDGDYLNFVELKKNDIRLYKLDVGHYYAPDKTVLK